MYEQEQHLHDSLRFSPESRGSEYSAATTLSLVTPERFLTVRVQ